MATLASSGNWLWSDDREAVRMKLAAAIVRVALEVRAEATATPNHAARDVLAAKVLENPTTEARDGMDKWRAALSNNATIVGVAAPSLTDDAILLAVRGAWNMLI